MTDVNIATQMMIDAFNDKYDMAMLISGDSNLVPPIKAIHYLFENKRVFVAFPPKRHNSSVAIVAKGSMMIGRKKIVDSLFEPEITTRTDSFSKNRRSGGRFSGIMYMHLYRKSGFEEGKVATPCCCQLHFLIPSSDEDFRWS